MSKTRSDSCGSYITTKSGDVFRKAISFGVDLDLFFKIFRPCFRTIQMLITGKLSLTKEQASYLLKSMKTQALIVDQTDSK